MSATTNTPYADDDDEDVKLGLHTAEASKLMPHPHTWNPPALTVDMTDLEVAQTLVKCMIANERRIWNALDLDQENAWRHGVEGPDEWFYYEMVLSQWTSDSDFVKYIKDADNHVASKAQLRRIATIYARQDNLESDVRVRLRAFVKQCLGHYLVG